MSDGGRTTKGDGRGLIAGLVAAPFWLIARNRCLQAGCSLAAAAQVPDQPTAADRDEARREAEQDARDREQEKREREQEARSVNRRRRIESRSASIELQELYDEGREALDEGQYQQAENSSPAR